VAPTGRYLTVGEFPASPGDYRMQVQFRGGSPERFKVMVTRD
jgi:hypothetical protein